MSEVQTLPPLTKEDYLKARATIARYNEEKKNKPKRQCSEKQLEALRKGREKKAANLAANKSSDGEKENLPNRRTKKNSPQ